MKWATYKTHIINCKVLRTRTFKRGGTVISYLNCYEMVPRKKTISHIFLNLVDNIQKYNTRGI